MASSSCGEQLEVGKGFVQNKLSGLVQHVVVPFFMETRKEKNEDQINAE